MIRKISVALMLLLGVSFAARAADDAAFAEKQEAARPMAA